jgi:hypothetical protein
MLVVLRQTWWFISDRRYRGEYLRMRWRIGSARHQKRKAMALIRRKFGVRVIAGPFEGLEYAPARSRLAFCSHVLLGTYEKELHTVIEYVCTCEFSTIIDIGAASGYYAAGFARRLPSSRIVAYEMDLSLHPTLNKLALANNLSNIELRGECDAASLASSISDNDVAFVLCDAEGAEADIFDEAVVNKLCRSTILIETHEALRPGVSCLLKKRFARSHSILTIEQVRRTPADLPPQVPLLDALAARAMDEGRGCEQSWLLMTPRQSREEVKE